MRIEQEYKIVLNQEELKKIIKVLEVVGQYEVSDDERLTEDDVDFFEMLKMELENLNRGY